MSLRGNLLDNLTKALKEGRKEEANALRFLMAQVKNKEIDLHKRDEGLNDEEVLGVIVSQAKKHNDSIAAFGKGGRDDLVAQEKAELAFIERYLPFAMSEEEIRKEVESVVKEIRFLSEKDFGKVMSALMPRFKGRADGAVVSRLVKETLQA